MKDNWKILILISTIVFLIVLSVVFVVSRRVPEIKELTIISTTGVSSVEDFMIENTETIEVSPNEGTNESTENVQDVIAPGPTVRAGLESTNPGTVKLSSGDIQFVELFAFW